MKMKMTRWHTQLGKLALPLVLLGSLFSVQHAAQADTNRLIIQDGNNALSNEQARQDKEQWDNTRRLRNKVDTHVEKEFDKTDRAFDTRDACNESLNVNAYWENSTLRCLDRRTGRPVTP